MASIPRVTAVLIVLLASTHIQAGWPVEPEKRTAALGQPDTLKIEPGTVDLSGPRARRQVLVSGSYGSQIVRDVTGLVTLSIEPPALAKVDETGFVVPMANGQGKLVAVAGKTRTEAPIIVKDLDKPNPVSFRHEVIAALNVGGCNMGACHGTPSGKNGFKLSLRGFDPAQDFQQLTRDVLGRRTVTHDPQASLLLQKGLGRVAHEGGQRFATGSVATTAVEGWLAEGMKDDAPTLPTVMPLKTSPGAATDAVPSLPAAATNKTFGFSKARASIDSDSVAVAVGSGPPQLLLMTSGVVPLMPRKNCR